MIVITFLLYMILAVIDCVQRESRYFYYLPDGEGLIAQLNHLHDLWLASIVSNTSIRLVAYQSHHYHNVSIIDMCDIFLLPPEISCIRQDRGEIQRNYTCYRTGNLNQTAHTAAKTKEVVVRTGDNLNFAEIQCWIDGFHSSKHLVEERTLLANRSFMSYPFFTKKYMDMLNIVKKGFGINGTNYWAAHWRRGDIIKTRCHDNADRSVNCGNETQLVESINRNANKYTKGQKLKMFLATNEENPRS